MKILTVWMLLILMLLGTAAFAEEAVTNPPAPPSTGQVQPAQPSSAAAEAPAPAPDPTGAATLKANPEAPVDYVWVLVCGFLVMFMQAGFAMVESGFCRAKNAVNLMAKNLIDFIVASLGFFAIGYTILKGTDVAGIFGSGPLFLSGDQYDVSKYLDFFWQMVFVSF